MQADGSLTSHAASRTGLEPQREQASRGATPARAGQQGCDAGALTMPWWSGSQKARSRSPRTPRNSGAFASSGVATAESLRMARQMWPTVHEKVRLGCEATWTRNWSVRGAIWRRKVLMGWKAGPE